MSTPPTSSEDPARREVFAELSIAADANFELSFRLANDFSEASAGFAQLADIEDDYLRAIVSDQIWASARASLDNLLEARLHDYRIRDCVGPDGLSVPTNHEETKQAILGGAELDLDLTGFCRALWSALDCVSAAAIGIARLPFSIQRASIADLGKISKLIEDGKAAGDEQVRNWNALDAVVTEGEADYPRGWFEWLRGMRNLSVHRARQVRVLLQRNADSDEPRLAVVTESPIDVAKARARFDPHLRRRPGLPDMQDLIETRPASDLWINEPALTTLPGIFEVTNRLIERVSDCLIEIWANAEEDPSAFPAPIEKWTAVDEIPSGFEGVAPRSEPLTAIHDAMLANPKEAKRLQLAERIWSQM